MSATDEGGLSWLLELDAKVQPAQQFLDVLTSIDATLKRVDGALEKTKAATEKAGDGHQKHAAKLGFLEKTFHHLRESALEPFLHKIKEVAEFEFIRRGVDKLIEAPSEIIEKIHELGEEMILTAAKAERTDKSIELLFGHDDALETLEYIEQIGRATEFADDRLKTAFQSLGRAGFRAEDLIRANAAALDIASFYPNAEEGAGAAIEALTRAKLTGRVEGKTLKPLGIEQADFFADLAERTGKSVGVLKKQMDAGKVAAEDSLEALYDVITKHTGKALGGAGVEMSHTVLAQLTHLKEVPEQIFEEMAKSPAWERFGGVLDKALDALSPKSAGGHAVFESLAGAFDKLAVALDGIDFVEVGGEIAKVVDVFATFTGAGITFVDNFLRGVTRLIDIFEGVPGAADAALKSLVDNLLDFYGLIGRKMFDAGGNMIHGLVDGIAGGAKEVWAAVDNLGQGMVNRMKGLLGIHSPSTVFAEFGRMSTAGFVEGLDGGAREVDVAIQHVVNPGRARGALEPIGFTGAGARNLSAPPAINFTTNVTVNGAAGEPHQVAEAVGRELRDVMQGELLAAFERAAMQRGG